MLQYVWLQGLVTAPCFLTSVLPSFLCIVTAPRHYALFLRLFAESTAVLCAMLLLSVSLECPSRCTVIVTVFVTVWDALCHWLGRGPPQPPCKLQANQGERSVPQHGPLYARHNVPCPRCRHQMHPCGAESHTQMHWLGGLWRPLYCFLAVHPPLLQMNLDQKASAKSEPAVQAWKDADVLVEQFTTEAASATSSGKQQPLCSIRFPSGTDEQSALKTTGSQASCRF